MAEIRHRPWFSHLRSEASSHIIRYRGGRLVRSGRGLTFWFSPWRTSIVEIPLDDRDTEFLFQVRSQDFQVVTVQGTITWRTADATTLAERMDFTLNLSTGRLRSDPLDRIASLLIGLAQDRAARYIETRTIRALLTEGSGPLRQDMEAALVASERLRGMGLAVVTVRLAGISPSSDLARALETPTFEQLQERADEATFSRRALAVEKERAIAENELATKVELARRQAALIEQEAENENRRAQAKAEGGRIEAEAQAARLRVIDAANVEGERARLEVARSTDPALLYALAARAFADKLTRIDTLNVTPDLVAAIGDMVRGRRVPPPAPPPATCAPAGEMTGALGPRMVLITRETDYEMLVARHATRGQTEFFLRARRQTVNESEQRHLALQAALAELRAGIPRGWRVAQVRRADLDRFLFAPEDVVVAVGQDGLVANVAKYLTGQPVIGVNPEPDRNPGILVPHDVAGAIRLLAPAAAGQAATEERTMLRAELDSGQALLALNEVFVGHASHQSARYVIAQGERSEAQSSSGVIVASGTGATGWALSIGRATGFDVALAPTERAAMFLVREPWPSLATGATIAAGRLSAGERLRVVSRMNEGGVVFADGMEQDRLPFGWGATLSVAVAEQRLRLVASDRKPAAPPQMVRRRTQARVAPPPASAVPVRPVPVPVARGRRAGAEAARPAGCPALPPDGRDRVAAGLDRNRPERPAGSGDDRPRHRLHGRRRLLDGRRVDDGGAGRPAGGVRGVSRAALHGAGCRPSGGGGARCLARRPTGLAGRAVAQRPQRLRALRGLSVAGPP